MKQLHELQMEILGRLLFSENLRFSDLVESRVENSQLSFHLNKLMEFGYVDKEQDRYILTEIGKEFSNRILKATGNFERQTKVTTALCCMREEEGTKSYLLYTRHKHPFYGCQGFPTEKVEWGEEIKAAAERGLEEETNLSGVGKLLALRHYIVLNEADRLVEDKLMHVFIFRDITGNLEGNEEGEFEWVTEEKISEFVKSPLVEFYEIYNCLQEEKPVFFKEIRVKTNKF